MRLGRTTLIYFVTQFSITVAGFAATFFIARFMGAAALGTYAAAVALVFWLNVPTSAIANAINKRVSEGVEPSEYLAAGFSLNLVVGGLGVVGLVAAGPYLDRFLGLEAELLVAVLFGTMVLKQTVNQSLKGQKKVATTGVLGAVERVLRTGLQIGLVLLLGYQVGGLLLGHAGAYAVAIVLGLFVFEVRPSMPSRRHVRRLVDYARYSWLGILESRAFGWMDTLVLTLFVSSTLVGIYEVSWTLASTLGLISVSIKQTLFPELSELSTRDDYDRIHEVLSDGIAFSGIFAIPGLFGAVLLGPDLLRIYRPEFTTGGIVLVVLIVARLFAAYASQFKSAINAVDRPDVAFRINAVFVATNLGLNLTLVYQFGWIGAAVATTLSGLLSMVLGYVALVRIIGSIRVPTAEILRQGVAGLVMFGGLYGLRSVLPRGHVWTVAMVAIGAGVYVLVLLFISEFARKKAIGLVPLDRGIA